MILLGCNIQLERFLTGPLADLSLNILLRHVGEQNVPHPILEDPRLHTSIMFYPGEDAFKDLLLRFQSYLITSDEDEQVFLLLRYVMSPAGS